jgi:SAM-dependent methyltransferase
MDILESGRVIALDKNPHDLHRISGKPSVHFEVREADFHDLLDLPPLDGVLMANALHYATDHVNVLKNVLASLRRNGTFILIEYDTIIPNDPWVPNPVSFKLFRELCGKVGLTEPVLMGTKESVYNDGRIYVAKTISFSGQ